jgi:hypothetical protein
MMDQASTPFEWHTPAHVELEGADLEGLLALGPMTATEAGDGCGANGYVGMTFAQWMDAYTSEEKNQFTQDEIRALAEDGDWTFEQRQAAEWYSVDPAAEADFGKIPGAEESKPFFDESLRVEIEREDREANPVKLISYAEMVALPEGEFLIHGVIVRRAKNVLFGLSNSFKCFMASDMGGSVSTGRSYHGMTVKKCPVIYVANEGANAVGRKRIPAWMAAHEVPQDQRRNIYLVNTETILPNEPSRKNLLAAIRTIVKPGEDFFLIIDVLRGTMTGSDSDDEAAAAWTSAAENFVREGATMLTVTHSPYSDDGRIRGSSHLWGSFEGRLHAEGDKEKRTAVLKVERFKDHDSAGQWGFQLDEIEIEEHPGETSLVPRLDGEVKSKKGKGAKLPDGAANTLDALRYALGEVGAIPPASNHIPPNTKCVTLKQWQDYYGRQTGGDMGDRDSSERKAFFRAKSRLLRDKLVGIWGTYIWGT